MRARERRVEERRRAIHEAGGTSASELVPSVRDFLAFLPARKQEIAIVGRLKRLDPDTGGAWPEAELVDLAARLDDAEVAALSLTTSGIYGGRPEDLASIPAAVTAPVLHEDPCLAAAQIYDTRRAGADAVLLPAAHLSVEELTALADVASSLHMAAVVDLDDPRQVPVLESLSPRVCVGLNVAGNDGFVDLRAARELAAAVPRRYTALLLTEPAAARDLAALHGRIDGAVIGDILLDAADPAAQVRSLDDLLQ